MGERYLFASRTLAALEIPEQIRQEFGEWVISETIRFVSARLGVFSRSLEGDQPAAMQAYIKKCSAILSRAQGTMPYAAAGRKHENCLPSERVYVYRKKEYVARNQQTIATSQFKSRYSERADGRVPAKHAPCGDITTFCLCQSELLLKFSGNAIQCVLIRAAGKMHEIWAPGHCLFTCFVFSFDSGGERE